MELKRESDEVALILQGNTFQLLELTVGQKP